MVNLINGTFLEFSNNMKNEKLMIITLSIMSIALASVFTLDFVNTGADSTSIPLAAEAVGGDTHDIVMEAVKMPDGLYAYRMVSYDHSDFGWLNGTVYTNDPSIPGPTIILKEGDDANVTLINSACEDNFVNGPTHPLVGSLPTYSETSLLGIHVHGVHYDISDDATYQRMSMKENSGAQCGDSITYHWVAAPGTSGAWPYHDHTFSINEIGGEELGLFGTVIVNPANGEVNGLVNEEGEIVNADLVDIKKDFVLWMVSSEVLGRSIFYGNEIDYDTSTDWSGGPGWRETPLWTNPNLITEEGEVYRFHVLGLGDEVHAFHLHGHRWTEDIAEDPSDLNTAEEDIIDVKEIVPLQRHSFLITASDNDAAEEEEEDIMEGWMYHCHVLDHMKAGMTGMMTVLDGSDDLPIVGAVFTLSDEPGVWMKTLNAGIADDLDEVLDSLGYLPNGPVRAGTGFPLDYLGEALGTGFADSQGRSLAVINPGETVLFGMKDSQTKHTITTLIYPEAATRIGGNGILRAAGLGHFDHQLGIRGSTFLTDDMGSPVGLNTPGLYVFVCKIHPYMFGAVIVDDPTTNVRVNNLPGSPVIPLLDLSDELEILTRVTGLTPEFPAQVPPTSDLAKSLLKTFYVITDSSNWKDYTKASHDVNLPPVFVTTNDEDIVANLSFDTPTVNTLGLENPTTNSPPATLVAGLALDSSTPITSSDKQAPNKKGVGEVWLNTQFETTLEKNHPAPHAKPGTITVVNANDWSIERKIALPEIHMNHPHNMWTDDKNEVIYQTEWFGNELAVLDRQSGKLLKEVYVGQSPSHVMTSPETGKIYIAVNGEETVNELDPVTYEITRQISTGFRSHPHGHWVSSSGKYVVTPDFIGLKASIIDLDTNTVNNSTLLIGPIATGMKGDESVFYTADFLGNSMTGIDPSTGNTVDSIDWITEGVSFIGSPVGLPIQTPISPDDKWMVTALTLGGKIGVVDVSSPSADVVAILNCDPGCHGVQWGAKKGGGYYAYVSSKFSNALIVVDPDPDNDGNGSDAKIAGKVILTKQFNTAIDDPIIGNAGMGGQGVLAIPNVYEGWIDKTVDTCGNKADPCSQEVVDFLKSLNAQQKEAIP